ncbi:MAG: 4-hydroxy-tetrahydrodipicolinate reductase [Vallitaleaceae bacterium]|nr:4-hydroxy-tetrahydrodipicolinate reductase [Vallitaleaceae bacterium]
MTRIIMHGCNGKMGQVISSLVAENDQVTIVAGIDPYMGIENPYPVFETPEQCHVKADVIIDFSNANAVDAILDYSAKTSIPIVVCTTGLSEDQVAHLKAISEKVAVLFSANMSLGINLLISLAQKATKILTDANFDIEIIEKHHNQKVDAPSGTALAIADGINYTLDHTYNYKYDRSAERIKRPKKEIGIHAIRGGTIVGEHDVIFAGEDEIIEINHKAMSKRIFAVGAVNAARFLDGKPAGLYNMCDLMTF